MTDTFTIRQMQDSEVEETYLLIDKEGWNLTLNKFTHLFRSRPEAFTVAVTPAGEVVGTVSFFPTFPNEYVLGNIVIKGPYRHKGMGYKLVEAMMAQRPNCVVSCTAVPGADQFYLNVGFKFTEPQQGHDIFHIILDIDDINQRCQRQVTDTRVQVFDPALFDDLVTYDREVKGYESREYVSMMVDCFKTWVARDVQGLLMGFAAAFIKREEIVLDSFCADSPEVACLFIREILLHFTGRNNMKLQVPSSNLFLPSLGQVVSSYKYNRYSIGMPTLSPLKKIYNVSDCDYSY